MRGLVAVVAVVSAVGFAITTVESRDPASAAVGSDFRPGNIISDDLFFAGSSMSAQQIQTFLDVRGASCSSALCLRRNLFETTTRSADAMCSGYQSTGAESAAAIVAKVGFSCGISPKVLLVTLQKESSLVTAISPTEGRYRIAMGYACPDTAPCDARYYGFFNQMYSAAWQLKRYGNPPGTTRTFTWYPVGRVSSVAFSPNASCGSSSVLIENQATAALYYYTPYQPNVAALRNLYGTGDGCSSYGNRNFWVFYSDWFGSPTATPYSSLDSISSEWGGVRLSGWLRSPSSDTSEYIWVNVDGKGAAYKADQSLSWFPAQFPGYGANHGFDQLVPTSPGNHEVCVYRATTGAVIRCEVVNVRRGYGSLDAVQGVPGGARVDGWAIDALAGSRSYFWISVDGRGQNYSTNATAAWIPSLFAGASADQAFSTFVAAPPGSHTICVSGPDAISYGCRTVSTPSSEGSLDAASGKPGSVNVRGWNVDFTSTTSSWLWVTVDGVGSAYQASVDLPWLSGYLPGYSSRNGFDITVPTRSGAHRVCVYGAASGTLLGCRAITVPYSAAGSLDAVSGGAGSISVRGWAADLTTSAPGFVWVNVNGMGQAYVADRPLNWFDVAYPGMGSNHGFDLTIAKPPGTYSVCAYGPESIALGCRQVVVR